jgi:hypothetical protein
MGVCPEVCQIGAPLFDLIALPARYRALPARMASMLQGPGPASTM